MATINLKQCIELPIFLMFFQFMLNAPVNTNFVIYRTCYLSLGYNQSDCEKLGSSCADNSTKELEKHVQPYANVILMTQSLLTHVVPAILCLFIGPWSDRHGRKPVLISTLTGFTLGGIIALTVVLVPTSSPWYLLVACVPMVLFGGLSPLLMAALCYLIDVTVESNRGMRIGIFEAVMAGGMILGTTLSSYIFALGGYLMVYLLGVICSVVTLLYVIFVLKETVPDTQEQENDASIFSLNNIREMFETTLKPRENNNRAILLIIIVIASLYALATTADTSIFYQFVREKFGWDMEKYTLYKTLSTVVTVVGTFTVLVFFHKRLKITETPLLLVSFLVYFASALIQGLATKDLHMYLAAFIRCISGVVSPLCRSLISKLIFQDETGKIFSLVVTMEALINLIGTPLYTLIYNNTLDTNPGTFNFVTTGMFGVEIILIIAVIIMQNILQNRPGYISLSANDED